MNMLFKLSTVTLVSSALVGCGGGGGGSSTSTSFYSGISTPASLSSSEVVSAYVESYSASKEDQTSLDSITDTNQSSTASVKTLSATQSANGQCGGSASATDNSSETSIDTSLSANNFCFYDDASNKIILDGKLSLKGSYDPLNITSTFNEFNLDYSLVNLDITVDGKSKITETEIALQSYSEALTIQDNISGSSIKLEKWTEVTSFASGSTTVTGKLYNSELGYVKVSTIEEIEIDLTNFTPMSGVLYLQGDESTSTVTFSSGSYLVEVDTDDDGIVDIIDVVVTDR